MVDVIVVAFAYFFVVRVMENLHQKSIQQVSGNNQPLHIVGSCKQRGVVVVVIVDVRFDGFDDRHFGFGTGLQQRDGTIRTVAAAAAAYAVNGDLRQAMHNLPYSGCGGCTTGSGSSGRSVFGSDDLALGTGLFAFGFGRSSSVIFNEGCKEGV